MSYRDGSPVSGNKAEKAAFSRYRLSTKQFPDNVVELRDWDRANPADLLKPPDPQEPQEPSPWGSSPARKRTRGPAAPAVATPPASGPPRRRVAT